MARNKGTFTFAANFLVKVAEALDPRVVVENKAELINKETWPYDGETLYLYNGLIVAVSADSALYMLIDKNKALESDYSGWKQLDASASAVTEIIDNLNSTSTTAALSANQGKLLGDRVSTLESKVTAIFTFKGTKATIAELPEDAQVGDVWHVTEDKGEYVWNSTEWELLGLSVDLSEYALKTEVDTAKSEAISEANEYTDALETEVQNKLGLKVDKVSGSSLVPDVKIELIDLNAADITALETKVGSASGLPGESTNLTDAITFMQLTISTLPDESVTGVKLGENAEISPVDGVITIPAVTSSVDGYMLKADKAKLDSIVVANLLTKTTAGSQGVLTGYAKGTSAAIAATDTINAALGKLEAKVDSSVSQLEWLTIE